MSTAATATTSDSTDQAEQIEAEADQPAPKADSQLLTVEGIMMLMVAIIFDMAGFICVVLIAAFGIGVVLGRVVSAAGLIVFTIWAAVRGSGSPGKKGRDEAQGMAKSAFQKFLKKHWKKLSVEAFPILGDISPTFLMMWYSELK